jgi:hypothetical protein
MIHMLEDGNGRYLIHDGDERIGWLKDRRIGFRGFTAPSDVREAIVAIHGAIEQTLGAPHARYPTMPATRHALKLVRDGAFECFVYRQEIAARLLRPHRRAFDSSFGLELSLPSWVRASQVLHAAHAAATAVRPHRDRIGRALLGDTMSEQPRATE